MSQIIQGISVRDHYPDYPKDLKDWKLWMILENHEIGIRTALRQDGSMNHKWEILCHNKTTHETMLKHGHSSLDYKKCKCYLDVIKARKGQTFY